MKNPNPRTKLAFLVATTCIALASLALAVDPPPDGGYPNQNTAEGEDALLNLTTGQSNTAIGFHALSTTRKANGNTAVGVNAMESLSAGGFNTTVGFEALDNATVTDGNTAVGAYALRETTTGFFNTAVGFTALSGNTTGIWNTAFGMDSLTYNTTGSSNTGCGHHSLAIVTTGSKNIALGDSAGSFLTTGSNNIDIGAVGDRSDSNTIRIGTTNTHRTTYIAGISGATVADGVSVVVGADGHLGTATSSARYKEGIKPMDKASEAVLSLKPVTFRYKHDLDPDGIPQFGLVAEQVEKVNPDLVARDDQGKPYTVRYEAVNAMLLNEFLKEHRKVEEQVHTNQEQDATITELKSTVAQLQSALKAQAAQIQKVSNRVEVTDAARQMVADNQ